MIGKKNEKPNHSVVVKLTHFVVSAKGKKQGGHPSPAGRGRPGPASLALLRGLSGRRQPDNVVEVEMIIDQLAIIG